MQACICCVVFQLKLSGFRNGRKFVVLVKVAFKRAFRNKLITNFESEAGPGVLQFGV